MTILGRRLQAFSFGVPAFLMAPWNALANRGGGWVIRNAIGAGAVATALLVVLAMPIASLETGPISPALLPKDDPARVAYEKISAVMGPGFATPFNIVVVSQGQADHRPRDAARARCLPGGDRRRHARGVGRRPG